MLCVVCRGSCCRGKFGTPINTVDWSSYMNGVKQQGSSPTCWAYAAISYLEITYAHLTNIKYLLAVNQLIDHTYTTHKEGGNAYDSLDYVSRRGIMTEFDYAYGGYDLKQTTPIGVKNLSRIINTQRYINDLRPIISALNRSPLLVSKSSVGQTYTEFDFRLDDDANHNVVVTNLCQQSDQIYVEYLNSYGQYWGNCGGYGYVLITNTTAQGTIQLINNRKIMSEITTGEIYDLRISCTSPNSSKIDMMYVLMIISLVTNILIFLKLSLTSAMLRIRLS